MSEVKDYPPYLDRPKNREPNTLEFNVDDVNLIGFDWKSPLNIKTKEICEDIGRATAKAFDDMVFEAVAEVGIEVDRDELIKALAYDRGQYEKGYGDGYRAAQDDLVCCRDCKFWFRNNGHDKNGCPITDSDIWMNDSDFCSYGERRDE